MSATAKTLKYYLDHPDEMPTDVAEIERLSREHTEASIETGQEQLTVDRFVQKDESAESSTAAVEEKPVEEAKAETQAEPAKADEVKPDGILAKDGKNIIPFSQLESSRARTAVAEQLVKERDAEIAALKAEKTETVESPPLTEEELAVLEADQPALAKVLRTQQAEISELRETVKTVTQRQESQLVSEEAVAKSEVQTAIDANPVLAEWQASDDQSAWNEASKFDKLLRESPKYANISYEDRFKKVVALTREALDLEPPAKTEVALTPEQIKEAAAAKLAAVQRAKKPLSLSDIPGGAPPVVDERQKVEEMSTAALGNQFMGMTREQIDAYLATL